MNWYSSVPILCLLNCWMGWFYSRGVLGVEGAILLFHSEARRYWVLLLRDPNAVLKTNPLPRRWRLLSEMMHWSVMISRELVSEGSLCHHLSVHVAQSWVLWDQLWGFFQVLGICKNLPTRDLLRQHELSSLRRWIIIALHFLSFLVLVWFWISVFSKNII